jgi:hypothetical protein
MTNTLTDAMVADMDSTADFMHTSPPPFPSIETTVGIPVQRIQPMYRTKGLVTARSKGITVTGAVQGQRDADRRDALRRGGL